MARRPSTRNTTRSPSVSDSASRTARGAVTCPFELSRALMATPVRIAATSAGCARSASGSRTTVWPRRGDYGQFHPLGPRKVIQPFSKRPICGGCWRSPGSMIGRCRCYCSTPGRGSCVFPVLASHQADRTRGCARMSSRAAIATSGLGDSEPCMLAIFVASVHDLIVPVAWRFGDEDVAIAVVRNAAVAHRERAR